MSKLSANCPRCGYDLTGTVATWTQQCPLTGRCNECGLEVDWSRVFVLSIHPWLFEYHWRSKPFSRFFQTILKAFQPRRFWREVVLTDPVHLKPATLIALVLLVIATVLIIASEVLSYYQMFASAGLSRGWLFWYERAVDIAFDLPRLIIETMPGLPAVLFAMPVIFSLIPTTLRQARVKSSRIYRIFVYSLVVPITFVCLWCALYFVLFALDLDRYANRINPIHWRDRPGSSVLITFIYQCLPGMPIVIVGSVWMAYWWHQACKHYLQLKETRLIISLLTIVLFLFATMLEMVFA